MGTLFDQHAVLFDGLTYDRNVYERRPGCDPELIRRGLEPVTNLERAGMAELSEVDVELLSHKLTSITEEARDVYMALSISEAIMVGDMNCGIFTASGDPAVVATGIYFHTMLNNAQLKYVKKYYEPDRTVGLRDGDIYFFNDELGGGVHTFDMFTSMPVFYDGVHVAWVTCGGHQGETGSPSPGGFNPKARSRYEEGLHVPMMRIGDNFRLNQDVLDMLAGGMRNSFVFSVELRSRVATMFQMHRRLIREIERRGVEYVVGGMRAILTRGERMARTRLRELNDGIFRALMFNDDDIGGSLQLTRIPVTLFKEDDQLTILVQGVSPENRLGPMHATWHLARAATAVYLFSYLFRGLPPNAGLLEPCRFLIEGPSIANAGDELAHGMGTSIAACAVNSLHVSGSKLLFSSPHREAVQAPHSRNQTLFTFTGENRIGYTAANMTGTANASGQGGRLDGDGESAVGFFWGPWTDAGEIEDMDVRLPHFVLSRLVDKNHHGFGKFRGGAPLVEISTVCGHRTCVANSWGSADKLSHNPGVMGGYAGPPNPRVIVQGSDVFDRAATGKDVDLTLHDVLRDQSLAGDYRVEPAGQATEPFTEGDVMMYCHGGGGGFGDVLERTPTEVRQDLRDHMITEDVALKIYGVAIDHGTGDVDQRATERRRQSMRRDRFAKAVTYDRFIEAWRTKRPPERIIRYYGNYPEPRVADYDKPFWGIYERSSSTARLASL